MKIKKTLALTLALMVATSTVPVAALEHLPPVDNSGYELGFEVVDSGPPTNQLPQLPREKDISDLVFPLPVEALPEEEPEKELDYICTFGCTHNVDEPCNFPEVEVIGGTAAHVVVPKGRAAAQVTAIDLTALEDGGGDVKLPCIFISMHDNTIHYKTCLNHLGTGTWNGTVHTDGKKDIAAHSMIFISGEDNCNTLTLKYTEVCSSNCGYKNTKPKKPHVPTSQKPINNLNNKTHGYYCSVCEQYFTPIPCSNASCESGGTCTECGEVYLPNQHNKQLSHGFCSRCEKKIGIAISLTSDLNPNTGVLTLKAVVTANGSTNIRSINSCQILSISGFMPFKVESISSEKAIYTATMDIGEQKGDNLTLLSLVIISDSEFGDAYGGTYQVPLYCSVKTDSRSPVYSAHTVHPSGSNWATVKKVDTQFTDDLSKSLDIGIFKDFALTLPVIPYGAVPRSGINTYTEIFDISDEIRDSETFYLAARDAGGNSVSKAITLTNIDGIPPSFTPTTENLTNTWARSKNVVLTANDHGVGKVQIGFNEESEYELAQQEGENFSRTYSFFGDVYTKQVRPIYLKDGLGNARRVLIEVDKLDNTAPTVTGAQQSSAPPYTTASVVILANDEHPVLGAGSGIVAYTISQNDTQPTTGWQTSNQFTVTGNGTYYLWAKDAVGNITTNKYAYTVDSADNIPPTPPIITKVPDVLWAANDITIDIGGSIDPDGIGIKEYQYQINDGTWTVFTTPFTVSETSTIKAKAIDMAGNQSEITTAHANIDRIKPSGTPHNAPEWTNKSVTITFTGTDEGGAGVRRVRPAEGVWVDGDKLTFDVEVNGTYVFEVEDNAGNTTVVSHTVSIIDKKAPDISKVSFIKPAESFFRSLFSLFEPRVEMYITAVDAEPDEKYGKSDIKEIEYQLVKKGQYIKDNAWKSYPLSNDNALPEVPAKFNGTLAARCVDAAGNSSQLQGIAITLEDIPPKATHFLSNADWTCDPIIITVKGTDVDSGVRSITNPDMATVTGDTATFSVGVNGTYQFKITDNAENTLDYAVPVKNIDLVPPKVAHTVSKGRITIIGTDFESGMSTITCNHGETQGEKKECEVSKGTHVYQITDKAGNTFAYPVVVNSLKASLEDDVIIQKPDLPPVESVIESEPEPEPKDDDVEENPETGGGA